MAGSAIDGATFGSQSTVRRAWHRVIFLSVAAAQLCLSGCTHYIYLTAADFHRGAASDIQFQRDNASCQAAAAVRQNEVGGGDPLGVYNRAYAACMKRYGHPSSDIDLLGIGG